MRIHACPKHMAGMCVCLCHAWPRGTARASVAGYETGVMKETVLGEHDWLAMLLSEP